MSERCETLNTLEPNRSAFRNGLRMSVVIALLALMCDPARILAQTQTRPRAVDLLPERTTLFVQIASVPDLIRDMQDSNFGRMLADERIAPFVEDLWGEAKAAYEDVREEVGFDLEALTDLPQGEVCFAIMTPRRKDPVFAFVMDVSEDSETPMEVLERINQAIDEDGGNIETVEKQGISVFHVSGGGNDPNLWYTLHEGTIAAVSSEEEFDELLSRWLGTSTEETSLADNRKFATIMNKCQSVSGRPQSIVLFCDPITLARGFSQGNAAAPLVFGALRVLGLDGVNGIGGAVIFGEEDYENIFHGHLLLGTPREGIFNMIALKPGMYEPENFIPENVATYTTSHWDAKKFFVELEKIVDAFTSEGTFRAQLQENFNDELEIDLEADLIDNLAGRITFFQWTNSVTAINAQSNAVSVEVEDVEKGEELVQKVVDRINEDNEGLFVKADRGNLTYWKMSDSIEGRRDMRRAERRAEREDRDVDDVLEEMQEGNSVRFNLTRDTQPCMAFIGNHFVITESVECLEYLIDTEEGKHDRLVDDDRYEEIMRDMERLLDTQMPSVTMYARPDVSLKTFYDLIGADDTRELLDMAGEDNKYTQGLKRVIKENPLPPFEEMAHYFPPQGAFVVNDDTGFHFLAFQLRAKDDE